MLGTLCDLLYSLAVNMTGWKKIETSWRKKQHSSRPNCRVSCLLLGPLLTQTVLFHMRVRVKTLFDGSGAACLFPPSDMVSRAFNYKHNVALWPCSFTLALDVVDFFSIDKALAASTDPSKSALWPDSAMPFLNSGAPLLYVYLPLSLSPRKLTPISG